MKVKYSKDFIKQYKKANSKIRKKVDERIISFTKNPQITQLRNHSLRGKYKGCRSIDITGDWRAIYKEIQIEENEVYAYFINLGTHSQLYR